MADLERPIGVGLSLLVVDDEPVIRQLLQVVLSELGFEVETHTQCGEARARFALRRFDLALIDKNLPDGSGLELCRELQANDADCQFMIMSGYANLASAVEAIQHGVADYFVKPLDLDEFRARLSRVVEVTRLSRGNRELIEELKAKNAELEALSVRDPLTRLFNHGHLQESLSREVSRARRHGHSFALALIDIDRFRDVNARYGPAVGDSVLRTVAETLRGGSRGSDMPFRLSEQIVAARFGGDVFALILPETDRAGAAAKLEALRRTVRAQRFDQTDVQELTLTAGYACYPEDSEEREPLVEAALRSLRAGKRMGGDQLVGYSLALATDEDAGATQAAAHVRALSRSLDEAAFKFVYQPIMRVRDGALFAYEALCRPTDPGFRHVGELIETAVRAGRIRELGRVLRRILVEPLGALPEGCALFVNIHPQDLAEEQRLEAEPHLLPWANRVVLEVTETEAIRDYDRARSRIQALREAGFRVALDDLGSGYSSLNLLAQLEPDLVKLDMELVRGIQHGGRTARLVQHLIEFCRGEGFTTVAEGIETEAELRVVGELGVDFVQGYLLGRPLPPFAVPAKVIVPRSEAT
jgi:diguanylate cyclase (GGDEF)-like protein